MYYILCYYYITNAEHLGKELAMKMLLAVSQPVKRSKVNLELHACRINSLCQLAERELYSRAKFEVRKLVLQLAEDTRVVQREAGVAFNKR